MTVGRQWSEDDLAKLKCMAGKRSTKDIAVSVGRSVEATVAVASKLKLSRHIGIHFGRTPVRWFRRLPGNGPGIGPSHDGSLEVRKYFTSTGGEQGMGQGSYDHG